MEGKVGEMEGEREKKNGQEGFGGFLVSPSPEFCTLATSSPELVAQSAAYCCAPVICSTPLRSAYGLTSEYVNMICADSFYNTFVY